MLDDRLAQIQNAMEKELTSITLVDVQKDTQSYIKKRNIKIICNQKYYNNIILGGKTTSNNS